MTSFTLSQVRFSVTGSCARYFQKLFTSGTLRLFLMSSNTARTAGEASWYSTGFLAAMSFPDCPGYSTFAPDAFTTFAHFGISDLM